MLETLRDTDPTHIDNVERKRSIGLPTPDRHLGVR